MKYFLATILAFTLGQSIYADDKVAGQGQRAQVAVDQQDVHLITTAKMTDANLPVALAFRIDTKTGAKSVCYLNKKIALGTDVSNENYENLVEFNAGARMDGGNVSGLTQNLMQPPWRSHFFHNRFRGHSFRHRFHPFHPFAPIFIRPYGPVYGYDDFYTQPYPFYYYPYRPYYSYYRDGALFNIVIR